MTYTHEDKCKWLEIARAKRKELLENAKLTRRKAGRPAGSLNKKTIAKNNISIDDNKPEIISNDNNNIPTFKELVENINIDYANDSDTESIITNGTSDNDIDNDIDNNNNTDNIDNNNTDNIDNNNTDTIDIIEEVIYEKIKKPKRRIIRRIIQEYNSSDTEEEIIEEITRVKKSNIQQPIQQPIQQHIQPPIQQPIQQPIQPKRSFFNY